MQLLISALAYASQGWHVFPLQPESKVPLAGTRGHLDASIDAEVIRGWWRAVPDANIGLSLEPSGLALLDVDTAAGKRGRESLAEIAHELDATLKAVSGRGGEHWFYRRGNASIARKTGFRSGLDLYTKGYVLVAPSRLAGASLEGAAPGADGIYRWIDTSIAPSTLPGFLARALEAPTTPTPAANQSTAIPEGGRNNALHRLGSSLRHAGLEEDAILAALLVTNQEKCNPPLEEAEVGRIAASAARYDGPDIGANADTRLTVEALIADAALAESSPDDDLLLVTDVAALPTPPVTRYASGFPALDAKIGGGITTRQLTVVLGPPAAGKSALAITLARNLESQAPVLYASTELERHELMARVVSQELGCTWTSIVDGKTDPTAARPQRIYLAGSDQMPSGDDALRYLSDRIVRLRERHGTAPIVVLDYLQDLARGADEKSLRSKIGHLVAVLRVMAQVHDCVIVLVSATSRAYYGLARGKGEIPEHAEAYLAAARDSGDVDYAAAVVAYLDVEPHEPGKDQRAARIAIAKSRHGTTGFVGARFEGATGRWTESDEAIKAMDPAARKVKAAEKASIEADEAVLSAIQKYPNTKWSDLRLGCGVRYQIADQAVTRLLSAEKIQLFMIGRAKSFRLK